MIKNVKCSQCEYLGESGFVDGTNREGSVSFSCKADRSIELNKKNISQLRACSLFRSRTKTAYKEVTEDIFKKISTFLDLVMKFFKK